MAMRLNYVKAAPEAYRAMSQLEHAVKNCGLETSLIELVKIRASQVNGCAYCIDRHTKELVNLTLAVATINAWNRFVISFRSEVGSYQPEQTIAR